MVDQDQAVISGRFTQISNKILVALRIKMHHGKK